MSYDSNLISNYDEWYNNFPDINNILLSQARTWCQIVCIELSVVFPV